MGQLLGTQLLLSWCTPLGLTCARRFYHYCKRAIFVSNFLSRTAPFSARRNVWKQDSGGRKSSPSCTGCTGVLLYWCALVVCCGIEACIGGRGSKASWFASEFTLCRLFAFFWCLKGLLSSKAVPSDTNENGRMCAVVRGRFFTLVYVGERSMSVHC